MLKYMIYTYFLLRLSAHAPLLRASPITITLSLHLSLTPPYPATLHILDNKNKLQVYTQTDHTEKQFKQ